MANVFIYICIGANSQAFSNTGALGTSVMNFPENGGSRFGLSRQLDNPTNSKFSTTSSIFHLALPVLKEESKLWRRKEHPKNDPVQVKLVAENPQILEEPLLPLIEAQASERKPDSCFSNIFKPPDRGEDYTILQALFSIDMLILFVASTCGVGGTLTAIDNLGQIGKSLGYPDHSIETFVSLVSIWNYLG
ncbi:hypothetical protein CFP56_004778 [Quercus suber]|uniref:Nodulin-like domain-containing protein n=1 Tax=Quercus suber TaxID=58331 RepID=A0AAW0M7R8_QUESU